jgi:hypothetical protein
MKHIKKLNEIHKIYNRAEDKYEFDPTKNLDNTATFYLHKGKEGFAMEILLEDKDELEKILTKSKIDYTVSASNILPF